MQSVWVLSLFSAVPGADEIGFLEASRGVLEVVPGFNAVTLWAEADGAVGRMLLFEYASENAASHGLAAMAEADLILLQRGLTSTTPELISFGVRHREGAYPHSLDLGEFLSIVVRVGQPGDQGALMDDLDQVMGTLQAITGYRGSARGERLGFLEEVVSLAFWNNGAAFKDSLPSQPVYQVRAFSRIS